MRTPSRSPTHDIKKTLQTRVVKPLFDDLNGQEGFDRSVPEVVIENRRRRAQERIADALASRGSSKIPTELARRLDKLIRAWAKRSFEDGFQLIDELEIQCARERDLVQAQESGDPAQVLAILERDYRQRIVQEFGSIELRGVQISHRVILDLDTVYVPLHLEATPVEKDGLIAFPTRSDVTEILSREKRVLIVGSPGSGKSTLVSWIATSRASGSSLPFVLVVRSLREIDLTPKGLARLLQIDPRLVTQALESTRAVLLIDGFDEATADLRSAFLESLPAFVRRWPDIPVIITSRPAGAPGEIETSLPDFQPFRLVDLTQSEVHEFIDKWCKAAERSVLRDTAMADREATAAAADLKARIVRSRSVQRIAVNPLLTTILCVVHRFLGRSIPEHRVTLYEKYTDALLYEWDRAKFPEGSTIGEMDANQKRSLLRPVARALHDKHQAEMPEEEVIRLFKETLPTLNKPPEDARRIVHDIRDRSGLLVARRHAHFGFSHLTFQEYLTALDYAHSKSWKALVDRWEDPWWGEVIALCAGVPGSNAAGIVDDLLARKTSRATILAAQCLETAIELPMSLRERVEHELKKFIPPKDLLSARELQTLGIEVVPLLLNALKTAEPRARLWTLYALQDIDYDPSVPVIAQYTSDNTPANFVFAFDRRNRSYDVSMGEYATTTLFEKAFTSELARRELAHALKRNNQPAFLYMLQSRTDDTHYTPDQIAAVRQILDAATPRPKKRAPTRAKNTG